MLELFKKSMLTGIGLALKTWDEVEALGKELEEKGKMPREEAKKFIEELQKRYEETQAKLEERVEKSVRDFLKRADIVTGVQSHVPQAMEAYGANDEGGPSIIVYGLGKSELDDWLAEAREKYFGDAIDLGSVGPPRPHLRNDGHQPALLDL